MKLPRISGQDVIKRLKRVGYVATRQKGSHVRLEKLDNEKRRKLTGPLHKGTLSRILKDAGIRPEDFEKL